MRLAPLMTKRSENRLIRIRIAIRCYRWPQKAIMQMARVSRMRFNPKEAGGLINQMQIKHATLADDDIEQGHSTDPTTLVNHIVGYRPLSLTWVSTVMNCQSAFV